MFPGELALQRPHGTLSMNNFRFRRLAVAALLATVILAGVSAQTPPSDGEVGSYSGLHAAAAKGDTGAISAAVAAKSDLSPRDGNGRTPLHVAAYRKQYAAARALLAGGADANALDRQRYDAVTIAAVANDVEMLRLALAGGNSANNVTSPYDGTALIAAAHLGHVDVVKTLIAAGAPLDHVNNLGWTALIESIVLGNGGAAHTETLRALVAAGANANLGDRRGRYAAEPRAATRLRRDG
jgi:ankyrin repeat protein